MHSTLISVVTALALSIAAFAAPLQSRQDPSLILADTVVFIAKTVGTNPNPAALPDVNNWLVEAVHSGAGLSNFVLSDPSTSSFNLSAPGYFRNGSNSFAMYLTAGDVIPGIPESIVFGMTHQAGSSNPGAEAGLVQLDFGIGTSGIDVLDGELAVTYAEDFFYACPNVEVEGAQAVAVGVVSLFQLLCASVGLWTQLSQLHLAMPRGIN